MARIVTVECGSEGGDERLIRLERQGLVEGDRRSPGVVGVDGRTAKGSVRGDLPPNAGSWVRFGICAGALVCWLLYVAVAIHVDGVTRPSRLPSPWRVGAAGGDGADGVDHAENQTAWKLVEQQESWPSRDGKSAALVVRRRAHLPHDERRPRWHGGRACGAHGLMALQPGTHLGPYEDPRAAGRGRHGRGYRARDAKLQRDVALKVLPAAVAADPDRLARFEREAQVLAALNHPHIGAIYGLQESESVTALVLELVEGPTLADASRRGRCRRRGPAHRAPDRRGARSRARSRHRPSRSQAGQHQGATRRHGEGARLRAGQGARPGVRLRARSATGLCAIPRRSPRAAPRRG